MDHPTHRVDLEAAAIVHLTVALDDDHDTALSIEAEMTRQQITEAIRSLIHALNKIQGAGP